MTVCKWDKLPKFMRQEEVRDYWQVLYNKRFELKLKRLLDFVISLFLLILFSPLFILVSFAIKLDTRGPAIYRQERVTQYGKKFKIHKFRTMVMNEGSLITMKDDCRLTKVGKVLRKYKIDELIQVYDVFIGTMTFVGTRPELADIVDSYSPQMLATLLLPAGITSSASVNFINENELFDNESEIEKTYIEKILPQKMEMNLNDLKNFSIKNDLKIIFKTIAAVFKR